MRDAVRNTERWKGRRAPTQDRSTNHLLSRRIAKINHTVHETTRCISVCTDSERILKILRRDFPSVRLCVKFDTSTDQSSRRTGADDVSYNAVSDLLQLGPSIALSTCRYPFV